MKKTVLAEAIELLEIEKSKAEKIGKSEDLLLGLEIALVIIGGLYPKSFNSLGDAFEFGKVVGKQGLIMSRAEYYKTLPETPPEPIEI
jgi:hypothetical protein